MPLLLISIFRTRFHFNSLFRVLTTRNNQRYCLAVINISWLITRPIKVSASSRGSVTTALDKAFLLMTVLLLPINV